MENFSVNTELRVPTGILQMQGDLTHAAEKKLSNAFEKATKAGVTSVILDFTRVEYINSAGMSIIISMLTSAQNSKQEISACSLSKHFQKIFDMVGLLKYIRHYATLDDALTAVI